MTAATRLRLVRRLVFGSVGSLYQHWALGLFSLVAAMGIWFVIQDVENPRIEGRFPRDPGTLEAIVKNNNDFIVRDMVPVSLSVDARKGDFTNLRREDFEVEAVNWNPVVGRSIVALLIPLSMDERTGTIAGVV